MRAGRWLLLTAAFATVGWLVAMKVLRRATTVAGTAHSKPCPSYPLSPLPLTHAEDSPLLFFAPAKVAAELDGHPLPSSQLSEQLSPGVHRLTVGTSSELTWLFRAEPFTPVLVDIESDNRSELSLVFFGATCTRCASSDQPPALARPPKVKSKVPTDTLLSSAASSLGEDQWRRALALLGLVPQDDRKAWRFRRLLAWTYSDALAPELAGRALRSGKMPSTFEERLEEWDRLRQREAARRREVLLGRWNHLTERLTLLTRRFEPLDPSSFSGAAGRFERLGQRFQKAQADEQTSTQEELILAGQEVLADLGRRLLSAKPVDCAFQAEVAAILAH